MKYSVLDLAPVPEGGTPSDAFKASVRLAKTAEAAGYTRYWLAEHHNMPGIASAATAVVIGHIAAATSRPESVIGMHFFSPANVMKLLENVRGDVST